jgi:hypothetical protein
VVLLQEDGGPIGSHDRVVIVRTTPVVVLALRRIAVLAGAALLAVLDDVVA